jgi:3-dehydroquinate dehydratase-1
VPSRLFGGAFGSALTFAAGERASAPGQVPIDELRQVTAILQRAMTARS